MPRVCPCWDSTLHYFTVMCYSVSTNVGVMSDCVVRTESSSLTEPSPVTTAMADTSRAAAMAREPSLVNLWTCREDGAAERDGAGHNRSNSRHRGNGWACSSPRGNS